MQSVDENNTPKGECILVCDKLSENLNSEEEKEGYVGCNEMDRLWFEEKKIIYELYENGKFDYNQLKEMLNLV